MGRAKVPNCDSNLTMRYAIIGCGLIGFKRAQALRQLSQPLVCVFDIDPLRATKLAGEFSCEVAASLEALLQSPQVDAIVIATTNDVASLLAVQALKDGKHVLVEKPAGRNPSELEALVEIANHAQKICRIGFNHRFHPGLQKAKALLGEGSIGELMYFRARYGHGGRKGYDKEWRADPKLGGGGELLDQGVHLIDLCRWLGGEFTLGFGSAATFYWDMPVEDNGFLFLKSPTSELSAWLHASCTEWKNTFDFEIFGTQGKLQITGLGGSYGKETLFLYKKQPVSGPPDLERFEFSEEDFSWKHEIEAFEKEIEGNLTDMGKPRDALRAVQIVYDCYRMSDRD